MYFLIGIICHPARSSTNNLVRVLENPPTIPDNLGLAKIKFRCHERHSRAGI
jgi:hypothetical protein